MDGLKIWVCIITLINLIFADEIKSDSSLNLLNSLKRQKLFYTTSENWIPPSLPSESECIGMGCCLFPIAGYLIGKEAFKKEAPPESLRQSPQPKFSIGISYSPGIAYAGMLGRSLETGEMDPFHDLYFNNTLEIDCKYYLNSYWGLSLCGGYMWTHLKERSSPLSCYPSPPSWGLPKQEDWVIWTIYGTAKFQKLKSDRNGLTCLGGGIEYYFSDGVVNVIFTKAGLQMVGENWGRGFGGFLEVGKEKKLVHNFSWFFLFTVRFGTAFCYQQETSQPEFFWNGPVDFHFSGVYLKVGVNYNIRGGGQK